MATPQHLVPVTDGLGGTEYLPKTHLPNDPCIVHCRVCHFRHCKELDCPTSVLFPPMPVLNPVGNCGECNEPYLYTERDDRRVNHARLWTESDHLPYGM
jgi:hypothetical protein